MIAPLLIVCLTVLTLAALAARTTLTLSAQRAQHQREIAMHERAVAQPAGELAEAVRALNAAAPVTAPNRLGHRVTVHTRQPDDQTIYGLVTGDYADRLVLEDAEFVSTAGNTPLPGRQDIDRAHIAWVDVHHLVARDQPVATE